METIETLESMEWLMG